MPLTDIAIRKAKPTEKSYKMADEKGLCLFVAPSGGRLWRFNYRFNGKQKTLALGGTLAEASLPRKGPRNRPWEMFLRKRDPQYLEFRHSVGMLNCNPLRVVMFLCQIPKKYRNFSVEVSRRTRIVIGHTIQFLLQGFAYIKKLDTDQGFVNTLFPDIHYPTFEFKVCAPVTGKYLELALLAYP